MADGLLSNEEIIKRLRSQLAEVSAELERLGEVGLDTATVIGFNGKYVILSNGIYSLNNNYKLGATALVYPRTGQVVEIINDSPFIGELFVIDKVSDKGWVQLRGTGAPKLVAKGNFTDLKAGDLVLLDKNHAVVRAVIEKVKTAPKVENPVTWNDIGGNAEAKKLLIEILEDPVTYPALYKAYNQKTAKGVLLWGEPGCGKTMLGKAAATSMGSSGGFILIKGPEVLDQYVGVAEAHIRSAFVKARVFKETHGRPAVIFVDEADSLLTTRGERNNFMGQTVVTTFLTEMDGVDESGAVVFLSTNRADTLDPGILRDGRIDYKIHVERPRIDDAREIMALHIDGKPIMKGHTKKELIKVATDDLYEHENLPFSGSLLAGCVHKAVTHALRRDKAMGRSNTPTGLSSDDFSWATQLIINQEQSVKRTA